MPPGLWRADPPPPQRPKSAPIPAQGQQPPRVATQVATAMAIVAMAWWPASGDPRPIQPRQVTLPSAPIPAQGQRSPLTLVQQAVLASVVGQWPAPTVMPPLDQPIAPLVTIATVVVRPYAAPPPLATAAWPPPWTGAPVRVSVAPLIPVVAALPAYASPPSVAVASWAAGPSPQASRPTVASWTTVIVAPSTPPAPLPPLVPGWPVPTYRIPAPVAVAPLTLTYGSAPSIGSARAAQSAASAVGTQWPAPWTAPPRSIVMAPLTLSYGQAPPLRGAMPPRDVASIGSTWPAAWWNARSAAPVAAWAGTVIVPTAQPYPAIGARPWLVIRGAAWSVTTVRVQIAPLTIVAVVTPTTTVLLGEIIDVSPTLDASATDATLGARTVTIPVGATERAPRVGARASVLAVLTADRTPTLAATDRTARAAITAEAITLPVVVTVPAA